ncbi:unnamed protein product [Gongylonema pulchrum]|uniref:Uncharacterized protein n=1 Tax=Gongylonema pulchrum TaxID=637853 RepID=A0A183DZS5_9BILA|nr:unnamed protein product [Gongylonema pulchrum]
MKQQFAHRGSEESRASERFAASRALASRSAEDRQSVNDNWGLPPAVPGSLATVLENLPLVYDTNTKNLQQATANVRGKEKDEKAPFKRGHHRRSSYDSSQIQLLYRPRFASAAHKTVFPVVRSSLAASDCASR